MFRYWTIRRIRASARAVNFIRLARSNPSEAFRRLEKTIWMRPGRLKIRVIDRAAREDVLRYFDRARMYLGISISDATSKSVLEALVMGRFRSGRYLVLRETVHSRENRLCDPAREKICERFATALTDGALVDSAAVENPGSIRSSLDVLRPKMQDFYRQAQTYGE
jgi:hypothetical protein